MRRVLVLLAVLFTLRLLAAAATAAPTEHADGRQRRSDVPDLGEGVLHHSEHGRTSPSPGPTSSRSRTTARSRTPSTSRKSGGGPRPRRATSSPGETKTVRFTFSGDGSFEMYCPIAGHKDQGMEGTIMVGSAAGGGHHHGETETNDDGMTTGRRRLRRPGLRGWRNAVVPSSRRQGLSTVPP